MPLSKDRNRERMRLAMRAKRAMLQPEPTIPQWMFQPNQYLKAHLRVCPDGRYRIKEG